MTESPYQKRIKMKFNSTLLNEIQQPTLDRIDRVVMYLKTDFIKEFPRFRKVMDAIRPEVLVYKRKNGTYFGVQLICNEKSMEEQRKDLMNTIKSLQVVKDNNATFELNDKMLKILFKEQPIEQQNRGVQA